jgi:hypothetical protein
MEIGLNSANATIGNITGDSISAFTKKNVVFFPPLLKNNGKAKTNYQKHV